MEVYIHKNKDYPKFTWDSVTILDILTKIAVQQGVVLGKMQQFGFGVRKEAALNALAEEIIKSNEIEGEILNSEQVRSSLARQLDMHVENEITPSHHIDGVVRATMDAVGNYNDLLTHGRLFGWHGALFPTGYSGPRKIRVGEYRIDEMNVVSTENSHDRIHYEAPPPDKVPEQMDCFIKWCNEDGNANPILKAAIAHLWFVIIHPFDDGNGRIARIITEMMLARAENTNMRFYSMAAQILREKKDYYAVLESTTTGELDITKWLLWFLSCLGHAIGCSNEILNKVVQKAEFWHKNATEISDLRQRKIINMLMDGFIGNMTSGKIAKILKLSHDTAGRLLKDLGDRGYLQVAGAGRSTHYILKKLNY